MWPRLHARFAFTCALLYLTTLLLNGCAPLPLAEPAVAMAETQETSHVSNTNFTCAATRPFQDQPPDDPHADPFAFGNWHINADRTLWVYIPDSGVWHTAGEKVIWIRPTGSDLRVSGQRLDGDAEPLQVEQPCCYPTGFEVNGLHFPTAGCWEVIATAGQHKLRFVIEVLEEVKDSPPAETASPLATSVLLQVCGASDCELRLYNALSGTPVQGYEPVQLGYYATYAPNHDLTQLALVHYAKPDNLQDGQLTFLDLTRWETITTTLTFDGAYNMPVFAPDNERLLVVTQNEVPGATDMLYLVEVATGELLASHNLDFYPVRYDFTHDGSGVMVYGTQPDSALARVALLDAQTLEMVWQARVEELLHGHEPAEDSADPHGGVWWQPATAFSTGDDTLYIVHADRPQLTTVSFAQQSIITQDITERLSWFEKLLLWTAATAHAKMVNGVTKQAALSPDGTQLYTIGTHSSVEDQSSYVQTSLGLQVIDLATAELVARFDTQAQSLSLDAQHNRLYLHGWMDDPNRSLVTEWTEVLDANTLTQFTRIDHKSVAVARRLDGTRLLLATTLLENGKSELSVLNPETFETIGAPTVWSQGYVGWLVMP